MTAQTYRNGKRWKQRGGGDDNLLSDDAGVGERTAPCSIEGEQMVLGCCLAGGREIVAEVIEVLGATEGEWEESFYDVRHLTVFKLMARLWTDGKPVDLTMVVSGLRSFGDLGTLGGGDEGAGTAYLCSCSDMAMAPSGVKFYAEQIFELGKIRRMIRTLTKCRGRLFEPEEEDRSKKVDEVLDSIEGAVLAANVRAGRANVTHVRETVMVILERLEEYRRGVGMLGGIRTFFGYLDKMTTGLISKELWVIAARPSCGKTSFLLNVMENIAVGPDSRHQERHSFKGAVAVGIFSLEMSKEDLILRMICGRAGVDFHKVRTGFKNEKDDARMASAAAEIAAAPIYIDDTPALDVMELRARARRMVSQHGVKVIGIDYLQLMHAAHVTERGGSREQEVSAISGGCKALAKELGIPVVLLAQLNREVEKRGGSKKSARPLLSDLRESGAIEQDADLVGFLWREPMDPKSAEFKEAMDCEEWPTFLTVEKQRNGPTGDCQLIFSRRLMRMRDAYGNRGKAEDRAGQAAAPAARGASRMGVQDDIFEGED